MVLTSSLKWPCKHQSLRLVFAWTSVFKSSKESSWASRGQEKWLARSCHQNLKWLAWQAWVSNILLVHMLCAMWFRLAKITTYLWRLQRLTLTSPTLLDVVFSLQSLYDCLLHRSTCGPVFPKDAIKERIWLANVERFLLNTWRGCSSLHYRQLCWMIQPQRWKCTSPDRTSLWKYPVSASKVSMNQRPAGNKISFTS